MVGGHVPDVVGADGRSENGGRASLPGDDRRNG